MNLISDPLMNTTYTIRFHWLAARLSFTLRAWGRCGACWDWEGPSSVLTLLHR